MSTIDDVKARLDIVETIGAYVPALKQSGRTFKARCPFHNERTPSFTVDPARGTWHCFGACSTGGDVIEFVRRIEGLDFREALRRCAERAGVELAPPSSRERERREAHERLLQANEAAAVFFQSHLIGPQGGDALAYLEGRGLDAETRGRWQLGCAPPGWRGLLEHLQARGFTEGDLVAAGLAVEGDNGAYDRFRDRVIFPTRDQRGRMIGFGARALRPDDEPKYLNTPQTPLFDKSGTLYGLDRAFDEARRADRIIVVEGYMDVIAAHQFGLRNVVASMGTAITDRQLALIKRFTHNVVVALDADTAGAEATLRAVELAATAADRRTTPTVDWRGLVSYQEVLQADIRVASLPPGEDPDSLVRAHPERFRALLDGARPVVDHLFEAILAQFDLGEPRARSRALEALAPSVAAVTDPVVRAHYVQRLARLTRMDERAVHTFLGRGRGRRPAEALPSARELRGERRAAVAAASPADGEARLLQLLLHREECRAAISTLDPDVFEDSVNRRLFTAWCETDVLTERLDELDEDVAARYSELLGERPDWLEPPVLEARLVAELATSWAAGLRRHRLAQRLRPAARDLAEAVAGAATGSSEGLEAPAPTADTTPFAVEVADATLEAAPVRDARAERLAMTARALREGATAAEAANEDAAFASDFADKLRRQRDLARDFRANRRSDQQSNPEARQPAPVGGDEFTRGEPAHDADL